MVAKNLLKMYQGILNTRSLAKNSFCPGGGGVINRKVHLLLDIDSLISIAALDFALYNKLHNSKSLISTTS